MGNRILSPMPVWPTVYGSNRPHAVDLSSITQGAQGETGTLAPQLSQYQFEVQHKPGRQHVDADALSRVATPNAEVDLSLETVACAATGVAASLRPA